MATSIFKWTSPPPPLKRTGTTPPPSLYRDIKRHLAILHYIIVRCTDTDGHFHSCKRFGWPPPPLVKIAASLTAAMACNEKIGFPKLLQRFSMKNGLP